MAVKTGLRLALRGSTRSCSWVHSLATSQCLHRLTSFLVGNGYLPDIVKEQQCLAGCQKRLIILECANAKMRVQLDFNNRVLVTF